MAQHEDPISHVVDHPSLELPWFTPPHFALEIELPQVLGIQITRFMVMELVAAGLMLLVLVPLARSLARKPYAQGIMGNLFEVIFLFLRDNVTRPAIGGHGADRYLPYLWTVFFFVLFNNLLGLLPGGASATGNINVTGVLALATFGLVVGSGMKEQGLIGFWTGIVPHMEVPALIKKPLWILLFGIEVSGLLIRHVVLSIRLFANMFAGHMVLAVILSFVLLAPNLLFYLLIAPTSIVGVVLLSILELFVAFLQAYIFTFLSAIFIGSALHPH